MSAIINYLYRTGLRRGARGGHWSWFIVALAAHVLRNDRKRRMESVISVPLKPGESFVISMGKTEPNVDR